MFDEYEIKVAVEQLQDRLCSLDADASAPPSLRKSVSDSRIKSFETKMGWDLPIEYKLFLRQANGMEGGNLGLWLIRGISESRKGPKFATLETQFLSKTRSNASTKPETISMANSYLVASDFDESLAVFRLQPDGSCSEEVFIFRAPDFVSPIISFDCFGLFLDFVVSAYGNDDFGDSFLSEFDDGFSLSKNYDQQIRELDLIDNYDDDDDALSEELPKRRKASQKKNSPKYHNSGDDIDDEELDAILNMIREASTKDSSELLYDLDVSDSQPIEPQPSPEIQRAVKLVEFVVSELIDNEYLELVKGEPVRAMFEDYMLRKLLESTCQKDAVRSWFELLLSAREVEDLYGTDDEIKELLNRSFDEFE